MCSGCHLRRNPEYSKAPTFFFSCSDCHGQVLEEVLIFGDERTILISAALSGCVSGNSASVEEYFSENFETIGFTPASDNAAEFAARFELRIQEAEDESMYPHETGVRLFRGECTLRISRNNSEIYCRNVRSKVISDTVAAAAQKIVADYLMETAFKLSKTVLQRCLERSE